MVQAKLAQAEQFSARKFSYSGLKIIILSLDWLYSGNLSLNSSLWANHNLVFTISFLHILLIWTQLNLNLKLLKVFKSKKFTLNGPNLKFCLIKKSTPKGFIRRTFDITIFGKIAQNVEITHVYTDLCTFCYFEWFHMANFFHFILKKTSKNENENLNSLLVSLLKYNALKMNENTVGGV